MPHSLADERRLTLRTQMNKNSIAA